MGFWSSLLSPVTAVTDTLFGGGQSQTENANFSQMTPEERKRLQDIESQITSTTSNQNAQGNNYNQLFQQQLTQFLAGGSQNPNPTPEQLQQATQFVDQTFTNPSQTALKQYGSDFQSQAQGKAAALGRDPNADIATQQAIAGEMAKQGLGIQAERGSRIAQGAQSLNDMAYNRGTQSSNFLNSLTQQAFGNQMSLLNARSGLAGIYQTERGQKAGIAQTSPGLLGGLTGAIGQVSGAIGAGQKLGGMLGGLGGSSSSPGQYMSSNNSGTFGNGNFSL